MGGRGQAMDQAMLEAEERVLDDKSTALHRAACHGDVEVLKAVLETNPGDLRVLDGENRTPLHVAAYQGKHVVFEHLVSLQIEDMAFLNAEDDSGRTAFQILTDFDPVVDEHRNTIVDELYEDVQIHLILHRLSGRYFAARQFYYTFVPLFASALVFAFVSFGYADDSVALKYKRSLAIFAGFVATASVFFHLSNHGLKYGTRAVMHRSAAHDLEELKTELQFQNVAGFVTGDDGEVAPIDVPMVKNKLEAIKDACKSELPKPLTELMVLLRKHLHHWLAKARVSKQGPDCRMFKEIAYNRADVTVTHTIGWPLRCPAPKGAVKRVLRTVRKRAAAQRQAEASGVASPSGNGPSGGKQPHGPGMLLVKTGLGSTALALEAERKADYAVLASATGSKAQCWALDKDKRLVPLGISIKAGGLSASTPTKPKPGGLALDAEGGAAVDNQILLWPVSGGADLRWHLHPDGTLTAAVEGQTKFLGYEGPGPKPEEGCAAMLVEEWSDKKLTWRWAAEVPGRRGGSS